MEGEHRRGPIHRPVTRSLARDDPKMLAQEDSPNETARPSETELSAVTPDGPQGVHQFDLPDVSELDHTMSEVSLSFVQSAPVLVQSPMVGVITFTNSRVYCGVSVEEVSGSRGWSQQPVFARVMFTYQ